MASSSSDSNESPAQSKSTLLCPQCSKPYERLSDVRTLNPKPEEEAVMREVMETRRAAKKASMKNKKRKAAEMQNEDPESIVESEHKKAKISSSTPNSAAPKINSSIATVAKKVAESLAEEESKRKGKMSEAVASLYGPKDGSAKRKETFMTMNTFTRVSLF
jgi:hypothetical protein